MRAALIVDGVVVRVAVVAQLSDLPGAIDGAGADVGDTWNGSAFVKPSPVQTVPAEVTMAQAVIALSRAGISETAVDAVIDAMPAGQAQTEARAWWRRSNAVQRHHPTVVTLAAALGLSDAQLDALFIAAAQV